MSFDIIPSNVGLLNVLFVVKPNAVEEAKACLKFLQEVKDYTKYIVKRTAEASGIFVDTNICLISYIHSMAASAFFIVFVAANFDSYIVLASSEEIDAKKAELKKQQEELVENEAERKKVEAQNTEDRETHSKNEPDSAQELVDWNEYIRENIETVSELIN